MMLRRSVSLCVVVAGPWGCGPASKSSASGEVAKVQDTTLPVAIAADSTLRLASNAIKSGHPWRAFELLAPALRDSARRDPATVLMAARAAAGWQGWSEVEGLLSHEPWVDSRFNGEARELLARAALERNEDTLALVHAEIAVQRAIDPHARAVREVLLARALDRANARDSARVMYSRASTALTGAREWLLLRAAGVDADSARRAETYRTIRTAAAKARIPWTEAQALERAGDLADAASRYAALGAPIPAMRLRLSLPSDPAQRAQLRAELLSLLHSKSGMADSKLAVELLDKYFAPLSPDEELLVARSSAVSGPLARALAAYARARAGGAGDASDLLKYGELLARAGKYQDAMTQFNAVDVASPLAGQAAYQRARALLSGGNVARARAELTAVASRFAGDSTAAPAALYLLADLATDEGGDANARTMLRQLASSYPNSGRAANARFQAAIIAYVLGQYRESAMELDSVALLYPKSSEAVAAQYWSGRARAAMGDNTGARERWAAVVRRDSLSYYADAAAVRLRERPWAPPLAGADVLPRVLAIDAAMRRVALLEELGMDTEARFEVEALERDADSSVTRMLATAAAFRDHAEIWRAERLASQALERGAPHDASVYRLAYPTLHSDELRSAAARHGLDPALVAGIIRQESSFNPRAVSVAGACGLMQLLPAVGQQVARNLGFPVWDPALLFDPDANIELGTAHLAASVQQFRIPAIVLAAYNAGASRAARWAAKGGASDPELYTERIPFAETRDYVRAVLRNAEVYRVLY